MLDNNQQFADLRITNPSSHSADLLCFARTKDSLMGEEDSLTDCTTAIITLNAIGAPYFLFAESLSIDLLIGGCIGNPESMNDAAIEEPAIHFGRVGRVGGTFIGGVKLIR